MKKNIFIVGIKGTAMSNIAVILKKMGEKVSGSDVEDEFITDKVLRENSIKVVYSFQGKDLPEKARLIIYSGAHEGVNNPQVIEAKKRGIEILSQGEIIQKLMGQFETSIAISGCHGKTTTSSLLSYSIIKLKQKPSYLVGAPGFSHYPGSDFQSKKYFVIEADEYAVSPPTDTRSKLIFLKPDFIVNTNIDFDHPDVYENLNMTKRTFLNFFKKAKKKIFLDADDKNNLSLIKLIDKNKIETYGYSKKADLVISRYRIEKGVSIFSLSYRKKPLGEFRISIHGKENISNAAGVILLLTKLGFGIKKIKKAIIGFSGVRRRSEKMYEHKGTFLFDDYAHHPREIKTTIKAFRMRFPKKRLIIIFHPHTFSRTKIFLEEFALVLSMADFSIILPIFPSAREKKSQWKITSQDIVKKGEKNNLISVSSKKEGLKKLKRIIKKEDIVLTMGAGDVYKLKDDIIKLVNKL